MSSSLIPSKPAYQLDTDGTVRPRSWHAESPRPNRVQAGPFLARFLFLFAFCLGVVATLAWQFYGDPARKMIAHSSARLVWLAPSSAPVGEATLAAPSSDQEEFKTLSAGLAELRQRVEEIAAQLPAVHEQMTRDISNKLEAVEHEIFDRVSTTLPRPTVAQPRKP